MSILLAVLADPAAACGGFFCNSVTPVEQAAEEIIFAVDPDIGEVTMHVQIAYQGPADEFAWVIPVSGEPELFVSNDALFSTLGLQTQATFTLNNVSTGGCNPTCFMCSRDMAFSAMDDGGVDVLAEATVGPYDSVVLRADSTAALLQWLDDEGYDLPPGLDPVLEPYVAGGQSFVALKLAKGNDAGDLAPLGLRYTATDASIPIQLTSIAATPDMPLSVFVLGPSRAIPDNYLHVQINEASIDWFAGGTNYADVIALAADEAGGQAFATDFSGSTRAFQTLLVPSGGYDLDAFRDAGSANDFQSEIFNQGVPPSGQLTNWVDTHLADPFDADALTASLDAEILEPLRQADELFDRFPHLTRLTSSLDATEMTLDPMFRFNADLPQQVSNLHTADVSWHCGPFSNWSGADKTLELADGRSVRLPSTDWLTRNETDELGWMRAEGLAEPAAVLIEDHGPTGLGELIADFRGDADRAFRAQGCGCASSRPTGSAALAVALVGLLVRRRTS